MTRMKFGMEEGLAIDTICFSKLVPNVWKLPIPPCKGGAEIMKIVFLFGTSKERKTVIVGAFLAVISRGEKIKIVYFADKDLFHFRVARLEYPGEKEEYTAKG